MLHRLRPRSIYDVMAAIACFAALAGGTAYAANTIRTGDIVDNEVYSADVRNDNLSGGGLASGDIQDGAMTTNEIKDDNQAFGGLFAQDLAPGSVRSSEVQDNSLTGTDINESSLNLPQTPTTVTFAGQGSVQLDNNDGFTSVVSKSLSAGSYAIAATANIATNDVRVEDSYDTFCELRNHNGSFIGGGRDRRFRPGGAASSISLSMNGGVTIPAGGGTVSVHCKYVDGTTFSNTLADAQMMIIRTDGFF